MRCHFVARWAALFFFQSMLFYEFYPQNSEKETEQEKAENLVWESTLALKRILHLRVLPRPLLSFTEIIFV